MIGANIAIIVAALRWSKYSFYIHLLIALMVIVFTLLGSLHILLDAGLTPNSDNPWQYVHNLIGFIIVCWIGLQAITGTLSWISKRSTLFSTKMCSIIRRTHMISSYLIMLMSKYNFLAIKFVKGVFKPKFILYLSIDLVFLTIYLLIKYKYPTLS
jgi:hypothetical protein